MGWVDAAGVVGNPESDRWLKTRFPTSLKLTPEMKAYAREAGFEPDRIHRMFGMFRDWNLAKGTTYSSDWTMVWFNWVDRGGRRVDRPNPGTDARSRRPVRLGADRNPGTVHMNGVPKSIPYPPLSTQSPGRRPAPL
jgi:hypothetical protein